MVVQFYLNEASEDLVFSTFSTQFLPWSHPVLSRYTVVNSSMLRKYTRQSSQLFSNLDVLSATCRLCLFNIVLCEHVLSSCTHEYVQLFARNIVVAFVYVIVCVF